MCSLAVQKSRQVAVDPPGSVLPRGGGGSPRKALRVRRRGLVAGRLPPLWAHNGWPGWPLQAFNRLPWHRFFLLCGTVGQNDAQAFPIGEGREWGVPEAVGGLADRRLFLFANDCRSFYRNNHVAPPEKGGPLTVIITCLA